MLTASLCAQDALNWWPVLLVWMDGGGGQRWGRNGKWAGSSALLELAAEFS